MRAPLTCDASSEASQSARLATLAGGTHFEKSAEGEAVRLAGVSMVPGRMTLAVIPSSFPSNATVRISDTSAAFEAQYADRYALGSTAERAPMVITRPCLTL